MMRRVFLMAALLLAAPACGGGGGGDGGSPGPADPTVDGEWFGEVSSLFFTVAVALDLAEAPNGSLSGTGVVEVPGFTAEPVAGPVSGSHVFPSVALGAENPEIGDVTFDGTYDGDQTIDGVLRGSLEGVPYELDITFRRQ